LKLNLWATTFSQSVREGKLPLAAEPVISAHKPVLVCKMWQLDAMISPEAVQDSQETLKSWESSPVGCASSRELSEATATTVSLELSLIRKLDPLCSN